MKAILKLTAIAGLLLTSTLAMANDPGMYLTPLKKAKSFILKLDNQTASSTLTMTDMEDHQIFVESINGKGEYSKKFDLSKLEEGLYFVKMESSFKVVEYTLDVTEFDVEVVSSEETIKPYFRQDGGMLYVNYLNEKLSPIVIKVVDGQNRVIFNQELGSSFVVGKAFNFKKALKDSYTVTISEGSNTYIKTFSVN